MEEEKRGSEVKEEAPLLLTLHLGGYLPRKTESG